MEIKFTVPGPPKGNVTLRLCCTQRKCEQVAVLPALKNGRIARVGSAQAASTQD